MKKTDMKVGYVLGEREKKPAGIGKFIIGCIDGIGRNAQQIDMNILGFDYLHLDKCTYFPTLYENSDISNRYNELRVLEETVSFDIVHSFYSTIPKFKKAKSIITIHDLSSLENMDWSQDPKRANEFLGCELKQCARDVDCILADSKHTKSDIVRYYDIAPSKIKVIYPGIYNMEEPKGALDDEAILKKYNIDKGYILSICTIEPRKNLISLIRAFEVLRDKRADCDVKLVLVGKSGWKNDEVYLEAGESRYSSDIIFTGYVENYELNILYKHAQVFAYISFYEGFGCPILEAMEKGAAVLTSETSSMPEVGGDAASYCNPYDLDSIWEQLDRLLYDVNLRKIKKSKAIIQAKKFSYKKTADETIKVYKELLSK